ncbi:GEVED domain-containing protein [Streptococcus mitis]|uniref:Ig-like domain-containing protein n=1 Tax=Streptococcus mitis TaxID=28037 RepID=UPI0039C091E7
MKGKQQQDFRVEKYIRYGIRKYSFGAASVAIAAGLMFLGNGAVSATEVQGAEASVAATATATDEKADQNTADVKPETTKAEEAKSEVKAEEAKKVNKAILEASIATLESKLSTAKYADATVVSSAKEVLVTAKATLAKADASQADVDAQAETVSALSTVVTESNTAGFDKKQAAEKEVAKAEAEKKATPAEKALSVATTTLTQVSSEAEVTNKLAETELAKSDVKEENKAAVAAAVAKNQAVLTETKALLADKSVTKEQVDAQLERLNESILAVYNELKNAGIGRDGKFAVNLAEAQTTALKDASTETGKKWLEDHGYSSLSDIKVKTKEDNLKEIKDLNDQIQWLDFGDTSAWTNLNASNQLQIGSTYKKELIPGYIVTMTVKELKPFESTETFKNRVAGTDLENTYQPDKENKFNPEQGATGLGANPQNGYTHVNNAGLSTGSSKTTIAGTNPAGQPKNGQAAGVKFDVTATYNGKPVKPGIVMTSGEDIGPLESEIYTTNGTPWDLAAIVGYKTNKNAYVPLDQFKDLNGGKTAILKWQDEKFVNALNGGKFATPDAATAGLGSQVFGGYRNNSGAGTPVLSTANVTEVGFYIMSSGQQSSMIGIKFSDFGDLPESYGMAEHFLRTETVDYLTKQKKQIQQPYLGKVKADIDSAPGTHVRGIGSDDATETGDEGVDQLIAPDNVHINKDTGRPEVQLVKGPENTYKVKVLASANGNDNYTDTVAPAYVRGFIDFNGNGKFDKGEESNVATVTGNGQEVELTFTNTQVVDTTKDVVNFRVRIAKDESQVEKAVGIAYSGEVEDNQIQVVHPPRGDKEETTGKQGETQSVGIEFRTRPLGDDASDLGSNNGKTTFNSYGKIQYTEQSNVISAETTKKAQGGVKIVDGDNLVDTLKVPGQGTYTVTEDKVIFTPEANFVGKADGIALRAVDSNGESTGWTALTAQNGLENINDGTHSTTTKTMDAVYIPTVTPKEITADPETSTDVQGKAQKKTPTFTAGADTENPTPVTPSATSPAKLIDPATGKVTDATSVTVEGQGTYTINPTTGEVTFQPLPTFTGTATGVGVSLTAQVGQDKDGNPVTATATTTYTPTVTAVTPTADPATSTGIQGETQKGIPTFTAGNTEVPIKENSVKLLNADGTEATGPVDALDEKGNKVGEYTVNPATGEVTFTPTDKTYTGKVVPAKVQAEDKNGTKVSTTYTPNIVGVTPTATPDESTGVQGETQEGTVSFAPGETTIGGEKKSVPIKANSAKLLNADGSEATGPVDALDEKGNKVGEYTIDPATNKVTFTPTDKTYVGKVQPAKVQAEDENGTKVQTTYTPTIVGVTPTADPAETTDVQGVEQSKEVTFKPGKATVNGVEKEVPLKTDSFTLLDENGQPATSVPAKNPAGDVIGTYTLKVVDGKATAVFTPTDKTYAGEVEPVTIQAKDTNGTPVTTTYTPNITPVEPTGTPTTSEGAQGQTQEGTPTFTQGNDKVPMKIDNEQPAKLIDPATGNPTDETTIPAKDAKGNTVGTYTIEPTTGKVTFTPNKDFVGTPVPATVQAKDANGTPTTATYTPTVTPVVPTAEPAETTDIQGKEQTGKPTFTPGADEVPMDDDTPATFEDGSKEKVIPGEGTYTVAPDGTVTFTPEKNFTGKGTGVTVKRVDKNGTPVTAKYTPTVTPVVPTAEPAETTDIQGKEQTGKPTFTPGNPNVPMDDDTPATFEDGSKEKVIPGEGTYTVAPDGTVTFTPEKNFTGKGTGVTVKRVDKNGTPVTAKYTPTVAPVTPTGTDAVTEDVQGSTQTGKPVFTPGKTTVNGEEKTVELSDKPAKLVDPKTGDPVDSVTIEGEGTYTVAPDGTVTFTPEKNFTGKGTGVTVQREDKNGTPVKATYTPVVKPATPTSSDVITTNIQGATQEGTPTFEGGKVTVNGEEKTVEIDETVKPTFDDGTTEKKVPGEGTYTIDENGKVTFTPEKTFTGQATGVTVKRVDKNGTPITAKYTPVVVPVTPTSKDTESEGPKGQPQSGTPTFEGGKVTINGKEVPVEIDETVKPTFDDGTTEKKVPGEGTYTIDENGKVTFTPEPDFVGKATGVTVKRVDKNGTPVTATYTPTVRPDTSFVDKDGKPLSPTEDGTKPTKDIPGYKIVKTEVDEKGNTKHIYEKVTTTYKDKDGNVIPGTTTEEGTNPKKDIPGYRFVETKKLPNGDTEHVYEKVKTSHKDKDGNEIPNYPTEDGEQPKKDIPGYRFVETKKLPNGDIEHVYEKVKTSHKDKDGNEIPNYPTEDGEQPKKDIPGYRFVETKKLPNGDIEHVYEKVKTSHKDKDGNEIPNYPTEDGEQPKRDIPGYRFVETKKLPNGDIEHVYEKVKTSHKDKDGNEIPNYPTEDGDQPKKDIPGYRFVETKKLPNGDTEHVYEKVKTSFKDKEGNEIPGNPSEDGDQPKKDIPGYRFVETKKLPNGDVEHVYEKVKTSHKDKDGNEIPNYPTEDGDQPKKDIPGYRFVETKKLPNGDVEHVYEKVKTSFKDKDGKEIPNYPTEDGDQPKKDIPGYRFVETKKLPNGDVEHVYEKVKTSFKDKDGNEIPNYPTEDGDQPKKAIPGYRFVETKKLPNGDTVHVYEKIISSVKPEPAKPSKPAPAKPAKELPNTGTEDHSSLAALGLLGVLSGFGLVARKKKED